MVEAVVEFDYKAQESDELTIQKGDVITNIKKMEGGWWEGSLHGKKGVFPDNFVKVLEPTIQPSVTLRENDMPPRRARVLYSYKPVNEDELELHENDEIDVICEVEEGWWRGKLKNKIGVFPSNFVKEEIVKPAPPALPNEAPAAIAKLIKEEVKPEKPKVKDSVPVKKEYPVENLTNGGNHESDGPILPPKPSREMCRVRYSYSPVNEDELSLHVGDVVQLLSRHTQEPGWWRGELAGKTGVFPDNFVEVIPAEEASKKPAVNHTTKVQVNTPPAPPVQAAPAPSPPIKVEAISAKPAEEIQPKAEDRPSHPPPGKKPAAPPPSKKPAAPAPQLPPQLPPLPSKPQPKSIGLTSDMPDGASHTTWHASHSHMTSKPAAPPPMSPQSTEFDSVERSAMLTHPTVTRVKAPRRRPPSTIFKDTSTGSSEQNIVSLLYADDALVLAGSEDDLQRKLNRWEDGNGLMNGSSESIGMDEEEEEVAAAEPTPPAGMGAMGVALPGLGAQPREWERQVTNTQVPSWVQELKKNQARKSQINTPEKFTEARLKPVPAAPQAPPPIVLRSPQHFENPPPLSSPRRLSPAIDTPQPIALKRPTDFTVGSSNGVKPVAGQRPPSLVYLPCVLSNEVKDEDKELQKKMELMEERMKEMEMTMMSMTQKMELLESALKEESAKRCVLEKQTERLKALVSQV